MCGENTSYTLTQSAFQRAYLMTVGVISAQMKMLKMLTP